MDLHTRAIALSGSGRLRNATGSQFGWTGITSLGEGNHALHLDGEGSENRVMSVTNGLGKITVVKEGTGTWTLDGDIDVSSFDVRGGVLEVRQRRDWRYYRFNIHKLWGDSEISMGIGRLALFAQDGSWRNLGLNHNKQANGNILKLGLGEVAYWTSDHTEGTDKDGTYRSIERVFVDADTACQTFRTGVYPDPEDESTWLRFVMRPNFGSPIVGYDICNATRNADEGATIPNPRQPKIWSLDGSCDGEAWTRLSIVTNKFNKIYTDGTGAYVWLSSDTKVSKGFAIPAGPEGGAIMSSVDSVAVSGGGTLNVSSPVTTARLRCDPAAGGGTVKGIVFAESGVVELLNFVGGNTKTLLPVAFDGCEGVGNIAKWAVEVDGRITSKMKVSLSPDGKLCVTSVGMTVIVR